MDESLVFEALRRGLITPEMAKSKIQGFDSAVAKETQQPLLGTAEDVVRSVASGFARGVPNILNTAAAAANAGIDYAQGKGFNYSDYAQHDPTDIALGKQYQPQTEAGNFAKSATSAVLPALATGGLGGASLIANSGRAMASGAAGYGGAKVGGTVGEAVGGEKGKLIGSIAGGMAGGVAGAQAPEVLASQAANKVVSGISKAVGAKDFAKGVKEGLPQVKTADDFRALARAAYKKADEIGGVLTPRVTNTFLEDAQKSLVPQTEAGKLVAGEGPASKLAERLQVLKDRPLSLQEAQEIDEHLGDVVDSLSDMGRLSKEGKRVYDLQQSFRNSIDNAAEADVAGGKEGFDTIKEARGLWKTQAQLRDVERIVSRAEMTDNPVTGIKTGFRTLANNPERMKGYSPAIREAINNAAKTGVVTDTLREVGSRLGPMAAGAVGGSVGGPVGALTAWAVSSALARGARNTAEQLQLNRANKVADLITKESRAGMAQRLGAKASEILRPDQPLRIDIIRKKP